MTKGLMRRITLALCVVATLSCPIAAATVDHLRCEYLADPLGIDTPQPRLSWMLQSDRRGETQSSYEVLVSTTSQGLDQNQGDLWDSGQVDSSQSSLVSYAGKTLSSGQDCYWKVRIWDRDHHGSDWSPKARFSIGLLSPSDWTGPWIRHPSAPAEKQIWFRKRLSLAEDVRSAFIYVASVGYHELYINGKKVDDRVLAPTLTRLDRRVLYVTYDISSLLHPGDNVVALWCASGWTRYGSFHSHFALRVQLNAVTRSGQVVSLASDATWRCRVSSGEDSGKREYKDNGGESVDARAYIPDWNKTAFDDSAWPQAVADSVPVTLSAQMVEPSRKVETVGVQDISGDGPTYKITFEKNFSGWVSIRMRGQSAGDVVTIKTSDNPGTVQAFGQKSQYICSGAPEETFENRFNYACGRFVTVEGLRRKPVAADIQGSIIGTDLKRVGQFSCSNAFFNQIYEADLRTFQANTVEGYTSDCPHRERLGYGEENFATAWGCGLPNFETGAFYTNDIRDWCDMQEENGWVHPTAPQNPDVYGGPMWSSAPINVSWEAYQALGDKKILSDAYPTAKRWLDYLASQVSGGLLRPYGQGKGSFLGDWARPGGIKDYSSSRPSLFFNNCVYAMELRTFIDMAKILGKADDAQTYGQRLDALKQNVQAQFFDEKTNSYVDGAQVQLAFPIFAGITPEVAQPAVYANFLKEIQQNKPYFDMGSSGLPVLLKFMVEDKEENEIMSTLLKQETMPSYGYFLSQGETCWPEYWDDKCPSRMHTCYTGIAAWFMKGLAGIRADPEQPGYQSFIIKPAIVNDVTFVKASTESPYGTIRSDWQRKGNSLQMEVTIPPNSHATVFVPARDTSRVTEGGKPILTGAGVTFLKSEGNAALYRVDSGTYVFATSL